MKFIASATLAALFAASTFAQAHEYKVGNLVVDHPMAFETTKTAKSGAGYLTITNTGDTADSLLSVSADFPRVMIHTTEEKDGIAKMRHVEKIEIPAGETVVLKPGGYHVMFMGLNGDALEEGEKFPATLTFENSGDLDVTFNVEARKKGGHDHGDHSNH